MHPGLASSNYSQGTEKIYHYVAIQTGRELETTVLLPPVEWK